MGLSANYRSRHCSISHMLAKLTSSIYVCTLSLVHPLSEENLLLSQLSTDANRTSVGMDEQSVPPPLEPARQRIQCRPMYYIYTCIITLSSLSRSVPGTVKENAVQAHHFSRV
ncbi:hypothetical protein AcV7_004421 [Taiwanofungus camphoratus]|nr:hypothetical protein AcV7_004421 [Antrodia cinnamomea]